MDRIGYLAGVRRSDNAALAFSVKRNILSSSRRGNSPASVVTLAPRESSLSLLSNCVRSAYFRLSAIGYPCQEGRKPLNHRCNTHGSCHCDHSHLGNLGLDSLAADSQCQEAARHSEVTVLRIHLQGCTCVAGAPHVDSAAANRSLGAAEEPDIHRAVRGTCPKRTLSQSSPFRFSLSRGGQHSEKEKGTGE